MWTSVDAYKPAAQSLGVKVLGETSVLARDRTLRAHLHFPEFGSSNGTLVFEGFDPVWSYRDELSQLGFSFSIFDISGEGDYCSEQNLIELLSDWGWNGPPEQSPSWLIPMEECHADPEDEV